MSERQQQPHGSGPGRSRRYLRSSRRSRSLHDLTVPVTPLPAATAEPTILGFPAEVEPTVLVGTEQPLAEAPQTPTGDVGPPVPPAVLRRAEWFGGLALVIAGGATGVSLGLPWWRASGATGLMLLEQGLGILGSGLGPLGRSGLWQPVVIVLGGGVLLVLGLLLFRPARSHRVVGLLALLVTMAVAAGVVVPVADANWSTASFDAGMWLAVAAAVLGLVGAVKSMETAPRLGPPPTAARAPVRSR